MAKGDAVARLLQCLEGITVQNDGSWMACCPVHDDSSPSVHLTQVAEGALVYCFAGCKTEDILDRYGLRLSDLFDEPRGGGSSDAGAAVAVTIGKPKPEVGKVPRRKEERDPVSVELLAKRFDLPVEFLRRLGLRQSGRSVSIPYRNAAGAELPLGRRRTSIAGKPKYVWSEGASVVPYGLERVDGYRKSHKSAILVEGESDSWALWLHELPAIGIPGAATLKGLELEHVQGLEKIYVVQEPDQGGEKFVVNVAERCAEIGFEGELRVVTLGAGVKDPAELRMKAPAGFAAAIRARCKASRPIVDVVAELVKVKGVPTTLALEAAETKNDGLLPVVWLNTVERKEVSWIWRPRMQRGALTLLAGKGGKGKGFIGAAIAALISSRSDGRILYFAQEDDPESVLRPRCEDAGADVSRIAFVDLRKCSVSWQRNLAQIKTTIDHVGPEVVIFDPVVAFFAGNLNRADQVRPALQSLATIAAERNIGILLIGHFAKSSKERSIEDLSMGSADWWNGVRSVLYAFEDPDLDRNQQGGILAHAKHNNSEPGASMRYTINGTRITWNGESPLSASQLASGNLSGEFRDSVQDAKVFLRAVLDGGPVEVVELYRRGAARGISRGHIQRARTELGLLTRTRGMGGQEKLLWRMPDRDERGAAALETPADNSLSSPTVTEDEVPI